MMGAFGSEEDTSMRKLLVVLGALAFVTLIAAPVGAGDVASYNVDMNGANEVPGPGDADGTGEAALDLGTVSNEVCVNDLTLDNIDQATAMHIHRGASGVAGPIVVDLTPAIDDPYCAVIDPALMAELITTPECFYLNVHTTLFPNGAIRGQLVDGACGSTPSSETTEATTATTAAPAVDATTRPSFTG
jgi:hypothetical protein